MSKGVKTVFDRFDRSLLNTNKKDNENKKMNRK